MHLDSIAVEDLVGLAARRRTVHQMLPQPAERRTIRSRSRLSQTDIARVLGVSRQTIARWETGERTPSAAHLSAYVEVLDRLAVALGDQEAAGWTTDS